MPLEARLISDAKIQAFGHPQVAPPPLGFNGGLVLGDTESDHKLRQTRSRRPVDRFDPAAEFTAQLEGEFNYGGATYHHFGHVMSEFVHRVIPTRQISPEKEWIFVTTTKYPRTKFDDLHGWLREIYQFLGVTAENMRILNLNTVVSELLVVEQGSDLGGGPKPGYLEQLADYTHPRLEKMFGPPAGKGKLYISRTSTPSTLGLLGERYFEKLLTDEGFEVVAPEVHPIVRQMHIYRSAEVVVFSEGSACHGVELLGSGSLRNVYLVNRRSGHLKVFDVVLWPRAEEYKSFSGNKFIGGALTYKDSDRIIEHLGVSMIDFEGLVDFFRVAGIARLPTASKIHYLEAAKADLTTYLTYYANKEDFAGRDHIKNLLRNFADFG